MSGRSAPQPLWAKLVSVAALLAIVWILGQLIGPVLVIFAVSTIVALLLNPLVRMLRREQLGLGTTEPPAPPVPVTALETPALRPKS